MSDRTALVTGGSRGIGRALAAEFASDGYDLVLVARDPDRLASAAGDLERAHGVDVAALSADLADPDAPAAIHDAVADREVDALVTNAATAGYGSVADRSLADQRAEVEVNVRAPLSLIRLFLPGMVARDRGRIVTVASTAALRPGPYMAGYHASKAYLLSLSESLAAELRGTGVSVTALCPGPVATDVHERSGRGSTPLERLFMRSPEAVAADGYEAIRAGETVAVPGLRYRPLAALSRALPRSIRRRVAEWIVTPGVVPRR